MRKTTLKILALGIMAATGSVAQADQLRFGPSASWYFNDAKRNIEDGEAYQLSLDYLSDAHWGVSASLLTARPDQEDGAGGPDFLSAGLTEDPAVTGLRVDALYFFGEAGSKLTPYVAAGIGEAKWDYDAADHVETQVNVGGGVRYAIGANTSVSVDARVFHGLDDETIDQTLSIGIAQAFDLAAPKVEPARVATPAPVPAPVPAPAPAPAPVVVETIELNILFATNSAVVTDKYLSEVQKAADYLKKHADTTVVIEGHTDSQGSDALNLDLSKRRAAAVADALVKTFGIDAKRVSSIGFGESKPVADNNTAEGRQQNRRVIATFKK